MTKEELEKEAEVYTKTKRTVRERGVYETCRVFGEGSLSPEEKQTLLEDSIKMQVRKDAFQDGAEFGYNKANEWHYVKDGDYPKDGVQVLSEKGLLVIYKGDFFCWFEYSPNADNIKLRKWEEPIAWKEIVLPKESE